MRIKATNYILLLGLLALAACGGSGDGDSSSLSNTQKVTPTNVSGKELSCGEGVCPEGIAMVLSKTVASVEANRCTGILIDEVHLMTNFHCLPEKAKRKGESCKGLLTASFLKDGEQINVGCDQVVSASGVPSRENSMQDFAVVKLDRKLNLETFKLNFEGRKLNEKVSIFKVDPINSKEAVIKKVNCELKANTLFGETFDGPKTSLVHTLGCETMAGNSGAPLLNENNEVIAIHQASLKNSGNLKTIMSERQLLDLGTATNLGCLCQDGMEFSQCAKLPTTCKEAGPQFSDDKREKIVGDAFRKFVNVDRVHRLFQHEARFLNTEFQWAITFGTRFVSNANNNEFSVYMTVRPSCIADSEEVIRNSESFVDPSPTNFNLSNIIEDVPVCRLNFKINKKHEISELSFDLNDCKRGKSFIDYNRSSLRQKVIPAYFGFYRDTYQGVGSPFGRPLTLSQCLR